MRIMEEKGWERKRAGANGSKREKGKELNSFDCESDRTSFYLDGSGELAGSVHGNGGENQRKCNGWAI